MNSLIFMRSLIIAVMSQIKFIPTPSWLVYFVLKAQPFFINLETQAGKTCKGKLSPPGVYLFSEDRYSNSIYRNE
jgi:hypothetical protein